MSKRSDPFAALGDPTRREILDLLNPEGAGHVPGERTLTAGQIALHFPALSRPAVSKHLQVLRSAGLVQASEHGREVHYQLRAEALERVYRHLERFAPVWSRSLERLKDVVEREQT